eukprot:1730815-Rhodomonas_salina.6
MESPRLCKAPGSVPSNAIRIRFAVSGADMACRATRVLVMGDPCTAGNHLSTLVECMEKKLNTTYRIPGERCLLPCACEAMLGADIVCCAPRDSEHSLGAC